MMFIIANKDPHKAVEYLISHTDKRFYFKQLIELGQLICSTGISSEYKKINRGKAIQDWIVRHPTWTYWYYKDLLYQCQDIFKNPSAYKRAAKIKQDLLLDENTGMEDNPTITTAIFRYKQGYHSEYTTNSELPIDIACKEYIRYIETYKFKKEDFNARNSN